MNACEHGLICLLGLMIEQTKMIRNDSDDSVKGSDRLPEILAQQPPLNQHPSAVQSLCCNVSEERDVAHISNQDRGQLVIQKYMQQIKQTRVLPMLFFAESVQ